MHVAREAALRGDMLVAEDLARKLREPYRSQVLAVSPVQVHLGARVDLSAFRTFTTALGAPGR